MSIDSTMAESAHHAIVYGASGLIGWAMVNELLASDSGSFAKVTAITHRPLERSESHWPPPGPDRPDLQLVSGIDLRHRDGATLAAALQRAGTDVGTVTHVYYLEVATNRRMFSSVIDAHTALSPNLQFVTFPGGTRGYGIYVPGGTFTPPLTEDMVDALPADYAQTVVYPAYRALLSAASKDKNWTWCEIGFTPNGSQFSLALHWAQYLSLYAYRHGIGPHAGAASAPVEIPFPGSAAGATARFSPVSSTTIARFMIHAALHPATCGGGRLFNVADRATPCTLGAIWPQLAQWFGLVGTVPVESGPANTLKVGELPPASPLTPGEYVAEHKSVFAQCGRAKAAQAGVGAGHRQLDSVGYWLTFDRHLSIARLLETGFEGQRDAVQGWLESFAMFRKAGLIL